MPQAEKREAECAFSSSTLRPGIICYGPATPAEVISVIIECTSCHSRYQYDEDRFERKPSKKIKCAKCSNIFEIHNPAFAERPVAASVASGDSTLMRRDAAKKPPQATTEQSPLPTREDDEPHGEIGAAGLSEPQLPAGKRASAARM